MKHYDKYKPSGIDWIGEVPEHWEIKKVSWLFSIGSGTTPSTSNKEYYAEEGVNWLQTGDLNDGVIRETSKKITQKALDDCRLTVYPSNSLVVAMYGATIGKVGLLGIETTTNQACCVLYNSKVNTQFAYYTFLADKTNLITESYGGGQPNISQEKIKSQRIACPPLAEQEAIAAYLDARCADIDKVVATQQKRIALLQELKQSEITQAVTRGLNPDARMKDSGVEWIGMVPEDWEVIPFKSKFKTDKGLSITKADLVDEGVPVISYGQIHSKQNDYVHTLDHLLRFIPEEMAPADSKAKLEIGDIVFADTSEDVEGSGNAFYIDREGIYAGYHTVIAKSIERVDNKYFAYLFATPVWRSQVRSQVYGVKVFSITQQILKSTSLIAPPVEERKQIVEVLEEKCARIDKQIEKIQNQIELLREYKQALITEVVTGKRKV